MTYHFFFGMEFPVDIDAVVDIALRTITKLFVFFQDLMIEFVDFREFLVRCILVPIHFVLNLASRGRYWDHSLDIEHVISVNQLVTA